jgi:probable HAF family extracellular repeat protein
VPSPASFQVLDSLSTNSAAAVSADGVFVVGSSDTASGQRAFRWSAGTGLQNLGTLPGGMDSAARAVSADGSVVVGVAGTASGEHAFRWSEVTGMQDLGVVPAGMESVATRVSADGTVVVGQSNLTSQNYSAFRWTGAGGMVVLGPGFATGLSSDGSVVVGYGTGIGASQSEDAFRWILGGYQTALGPSVEPGATWPSSISSDGQVIVGYRLDANRNYRAFRWTEADGAVSLPPLAADDPSYADCYGYDTNRDGSVVVGADDNGTSSSVIDAVVWTAATGTVRVVDQLPAGSVPPDWLLRTANGVSADGHVVVGSGRATFSGPSQAWVATLATECP